MKRSNNTRQTGFRYGTVAMAIKPPEIGMFSRYDAMEGLTAEL